MIFRRNLIINVKKIFKYKRAYRWGVFRLYVTRSYDKGLYVDIVYKPFYLISRRNVTRKYFCKNNIKSILEFSDPLLTWEDYL